MLNYIHLSDKLASVLTQAQLTHSNFITQKVRNCCIFLTAYEQEATSIEDINCETAQISSLHSSSLIAISGVTRMKPYGS